MEFRTSHCSWKSAELALDFTAKTLPLIEESSNPLPKAIYISFLTIKEGRRLTALHYDFVVIDLFQSTLAFSEELSCGSVLVIAIGTFYCCFQKVGIKISRVLTTELPLFCIYSDTRCNINGSTLLAG